MANFNLYPKKSQVLQSHGGPPVPTGEYLGVDDELPFTKVGHVSFQYIYYKI